MRGSRKLDSKSQRTLHMAELSLKILVVLSLTLPFFLGMTLLHPIEPTGRMIRDWFEIDLKTFDLKREKVVILLYLQMAIFTATNTCILLMILDILYYSLTLTSLNGMIPKEVVISTKNNYGADKNRYSLSTNLFGVIEDTQLAELHRIQHLLNTLLNEILATVLISFHHIGLLAAVVILTCFGIRFQEIILESGVVAVIVIITAIIAPLIVEYEESVLFGHIVESSETFIKMGKKLVRKRTLFGRFLRSCRTFYVQEAYPFFTIDKQTFFMFCDRALDYIVVLLLW